MNTARFPILLLLLALTAEAGDQFSYRPKRLTYDLASPFDDPTAQKLPPAKLTIATQPDAAGHFNLDTRSAPLTSIEVELGKERLSVPKQLLNDIGPFDLHTIDFYWVGGRYYVAICRERPADGRQEALDFVFRDGKLVDLYFSGTSQRDKYPKVFQGTTPWPEPAKLK